MKKLAILLLLCVVTLSCSSCQTQGENLDVSEETSVLQSDSSVTSEEQTYTEEKTFIPGKELICPQGNTFSLYGQAYTHDSMTMSEKRENYKVEISSFKAVMLKEADINNLDDYLANRTFFPYIYEIEIVGKIDSKYANKTTTIGVRFPVDGDLTFYDSYFNNDPSFVGQFVTINADGSFKLKTRVGFCSIQDTIMITSVYSY